LSLCFSSYGSRRPDGGELLRYALGTIILASAISEAVVRHVK
jgi:hypothetical protein